MILGSVRTATSAATLAMAALIAAPSTASAQSDMSGGSNDWPASSPSLDLQLQGGAVLPTGELGDYAGVGLDLGAGADWWLNDHVALRLNGSVAALPGDDGLPGVVSGMPDMRLWHLTGGLQFDVGGRNDDRPWTLEADVGAGSTMLDTNDFMDTNRLVEDVTHTYPHVTGGVKLGYELGDNVLASVGSQAYVTFTDQTDLQPLSALSPAADPMDRAVTFPITASVEVDLPNG